MEPAERRLTQLIDKFDLRGSLFEQLIREPEGWAQPDRLQDSPSLQRFAMDVRHSAMKLRPFQFTTMMLTNGLGMAKSYQVRLSR